MSRRLMTILLWLGSTALAGAQAPLDSLKARLSGELSAYLADQAASDTFSGVVVVAHHGTPIYSKAFGLADRERKVPNTVDMRFNLGSIDKTFTAIAIAQLVVAGRVSVDSTIGAYLPDYPNRDAAAHVTVRQLLTHTSGVGDYFKPEFIDKHQRIARATDLFPYFAADSLDFRPGARFGYSNGGFAVLGAIIERVSGQTYFDYVQQHIFDVAGMPNTSFDPVPGVTAVGYSRDGATRGPGGSPGSGPRRPNTMEIEPRGSPAGGGYSTAHDLIAFSRAIWSGKLVPRPLVDEFTTGRIAIGPYKYAFGFTELMLGTVRAVGHNGGAAGVNAEFDMYPDLDLDVVVLSNYDPPAASRVMGKIRRLITR